MSGVTSTAKPAPVLAVLLVLVWLLGFGGGAAWIVYSQVSGEATTATVTDCERTGKPATYTCRGSWALDDSVRTGGVIEGVSEDDVGDEVEVRVKGERAYSLSLRLPIILGVIALSVPVLALVAVVRGRRSPPITEP